MSTIKRFEDLEIWQLARDLSREVNLYTKKNPFSRDFALVDQIKRSVGSSMDNIAEGFERDGKKEFIQFLSISKASIGETRSQLYRAFDFGYISKKELDKTLIKLITLSTKIQSLISYLMKTNIRGKKFQ